MDQCCMFLTCICMVLCKHSDEEKSMFCKNLACDQRDNHRVCGIREEFKGLRFKLFENECQLLKYGCDVDDDKAYGLINIEYCEKVFSEDANEYVKHDSELPNESYKSEDVRNEINECAHINCKSDTEVNVCGMKKHYSGYKVRLFPNKCELLMHNCRTNATFEVTDLFICDTILKNSSNLIQDETIQSDTSKEVSNKVKNIVIIDTNMLGFGDNINETIESFFAATHVLDLPMRELSPDLVDEFTRRREIKIAGPVKVFQPWTTIPKNVSDDYMHIPTLSSCYHKCPTKCPDTYAPVCGVPGIVAREPSLMFQNHCFMDVAQCKMRWEEKSPTAISSSYIESSFMFCLGDQLNAMYRFLPLVRTLQHMGRLKKKGRFKYKLRNMRFFNSLLSRDPKLMG